MNEQDIINMKANFEAQLDTLKAEIASLKAQPTPERMKPEQPASNPMIRDAGDFVKLAESIKNMMPKQPTLVEQIKELLVIQKTLGELGGFNGVEDIADIADTGNPEDALLMKFLETLMPKKEAPPQAPEENEPQKSAIDIVSEIKTPPTTPKENEKSKRKALIDAEISKLPPTAIQAAKTLSKEEVKKRITAVFPLTDAEFEYAYKKVLAL